MMGARIVLEHDRVSLMEQDHIFFEHEQSFDLYLDLVSLCLWSRSHGNTNSGFDRLLSLICDWQQARLAHTGTDRRGQAVSLKLSWQQAGSHGHRPSGPSCFSEVVMATGWLTQAQTVRAKLFL